MTKQAGMVDIYEFDDDIKVGVTRRTNENPHTTREVEQAIRRSELRKAEHESRNSVVFRRSELPQRPLTAKLATTAVVKPVAAPPPPPSHVPEPDEDDEDEAAPTSLNRKKMPIRQRLALWRRMTQLHDRDRKSFEEIAEILNKEGVLRPTGNKWDGLYIAYAYRTFCEYREIMGIERVTPMDSGLPEYFRSMLVDTKLSIEKKVAVLKAIQPNFPTSVALMLEDGELVEDQKMAILSIIIRKELTQ